MLKVLPCTSIAIETNFRYAGLVEVRKSIGLFFSDYSTAGRFFRV